MLFPSSKDSSHSQPRPHFARAVFNPRVFISLAMACREVAPPARISSIPGPAAGLSAVPATVRDGTPLHPANPALSIAAGAVTRTASDLPAKDAAIR